MRRAASLAHVDEQIRRLLDLSHPDPHSVLGIHPDGDGVVVRTFRPDAERVTVLPDFGGRVPAVHRRGGVFEARLNNRRDLFGYLVEVRYPGGATFTLRDPYSFPPTLGELDSHLAAEGRHERLWERLGAHPAHHRGTYGTSFAVWAPTARSVSVVGFAPRLRRKPRRWCTRWISTSGRTPTSSSHAPPQTRSSGPSPSTKCTSAPGAAWWRRAIGR